MKRQLSILLAILLLMLSVCVPVSAAENTVTSYASVSYDDYASVSYNAAGATLTPELEAYLLRELSSFPYSIDVRKYNIPLDDIFDVYMSFIKKHPELFYLSGALLYTNDAGSSVTKEIIPQYFYDDESEIQKRCEEFNREVDKAIASAAYCKTDFQKALAIHDYIVTSAEYMATNRLLDEAHESYGVLVNKKGDCQAYALAYQVVMEKMGIPCYIAHAPNHVWNVIKLDGNWYHADLSGDDTTDDNLGRVYHTFFLLSDTALEEIGGVYANWKCDYTCTSTTYDNYWWKNISTAFIQYDGYAYYSPNLNVGINRITASSLDVGSTSGQETVVPITEKQVPGADWYTRLAYYGGYIYYNTLKDIGRYDLKTGEYGTFYTPTLSAGNSIYGVAERDGYLWYTQKSSPSGNDSLYKVETKLVSQIPETPPTTQPTTQPTTKPTAQPTTQPTTQPATENSVTLNKTSITLGVGESYTLKASGQSPYKWSTSNNGIVTVNDGKITAKKSGTATVTVTAANGKTATCKVTVKAAPKSVKLNKKSITLGVGEQFDLDSFVNSGAAAYSRKYSSANSGIASVKQAGGIVTAMNPGVTSVTLTCYNGVKTTCKITVKAAPTSVRLNKKSITLGVGEQFDLDSFVNAGAGAYSRKYSSDNANIASVKQAGGIVTAKNPGVTSITLTCYNGVKTTCKITVKAAPTSVRLNKKSITLKVGKKFDLDSYVNAGAGAYSRKYSSANSGIASVKQAGGIVTAKKPGVTWVTLTCYNGVKTTCKITVKR